LLSKHLYFIFKKICETKEIYLNKSLADRGDIVFSKSNQVEDQRGHIGCYYLLSFGELVRFRKLCKIPLEWKE
jgi:hypothetical protein